MTINPGMVAPPGLLDGQPLEPLLSFIEGLRSPSEKWAVVFGAGLSKGADLPDWDDLLRSVGHLIGLDTKREVLPKQNYPATLKECADQADDPGEFWRLVTDLLCREATPSRAQSHLASLPFDLFVSLNYDCLLESHWKETRTGLLDGVIAYPNIDLTSLNQGRLLYLHGRCPSVGLLSDATCVLTETGYDVAYAEPSTLELALEVIFQQYNVLFVGTSVADPDLASILTKVERRLSRQQRTEAQQPMRIALVATKEPSYTPNMELLEPVRAFRIKPIWYTNPDGRHLQLERLLNYLSEAVV